MLQGIYIDNFMLFEQVSIDVSSDFVVVTGETGAGKSLFLQSLKFVSGGKKPSAPPPNPDAPTSVSCKIHIDALRHIPQDIADLIQGQLEQTPADAFEIKRSLSPQGKSKMSIAGVTANTAQAKAIMQMFFEINAQHQHLTVLEARTQRTLLDRYADNFDQLKTVAACYQDWQALVMRQKKLQIALAEFEAVDYLQSVLDDIDQLELGDLDLDRLHQEQKILHGRQAFLHNCQALQQQLDGEHDHAVTSQLYQMQHSLDAYHEQYPKTTDISQCLRDACTMAQEATNVLQSLLDSDYSADAERLSQIESQLSATHDCARKYRLQPEALHEFAQKCATQIEKHGQYTQELAELMPLARVKTPTIAQLMLYQPLAWQTPKN